MWCDVAVSWAVGAGAGALFGRSGVTLSYLGVDRVVTFWDDLF